MTCPATSFARCCLRRPRSGKTLKWSDFPSTDGCPIQASSNKTTKTSHEFRRRILGRRTRQRSGVVPAGRASNCFCLGLQERSCHGSLYFPHSVYTLVLTDVEFEWDEYKQRANTFKHGLDFTTAAMVFADPHLVLREDRTDDGGEQRWHALGQAGRRP